MIHNNQPIKIILLCESGVGKTNLINVFFGLDFQDIIPSNISSICYEGNYTYKDKS